MRGDEEGMHQCGGRGNVKWAFSGNGYRDFSRSPQNSEQLRKMEFSRGGPRKVDFSCFFAIY